MGNGKWSTPIQSSISQFEFLFEQLSTIKLFQCFHIQMVAVPFLRNNPSAVMFFQRFIFPAYNITFQGRIQDFKLAGTHLKKLRRAEEGAVAVF
jgi:hypothetical protein